MTTFAKQYDYLFYDLADSRTKNWSLMQGPGPVIGILAIYLATVYVFLPAYMKNRKAFSLKNVLFYYNLFQIVACVGLIYGVLTSGWTTHYTLGCQVIDYSDDPLALRMLSMVYWTFILKVIEMVETCFFILRKKDNQVSKLHVYHHSSTALLGWIGVKYIGGGMATFPIIINSMIHVMMYTYYLLSALGPEWQKKLTSWKPKLTTAQMIQFGILVAHSLQALYPSCKVPKLVLLFYVPNVILLYFMFFDFYKASYLKKQQQKLDKNSNETQRNGNAKKLK